MASMVVSCRGVGACPGAFASTAKKRPRELPTKSSDGAPKPLLEKVKKEAAEEAKGKLEAAGATVTVK